MTDDDANLHSTTVYKIVPLALWRMAEASRLFAGSVDDVRDGFIHLSAAKQIAGTLDKYFRDQPDLLLIAFDSADLEPHLKWEASRGGELFPHYYNPLPVDFALWQRHLPIDADGRPEFNEDTL